MNLLLRTKVYNIIPLFVIINASLALFFVRYDLVVPIQKLLEVIFFLYILILCQFRPVVDKRSGIIIMVITLYVVGSAIYALVLGSSNIFDFLMVYKAFIYLLCLSLISRKYLIPSDQLRIFFYFLLSLFLIKYSLVQLLEFSHRPRLLLENNFELMLLYSVYLLKNYNEPKYHLVDLGALAVITLLSFSRSSVIVFAVVLFYVFYSNQTRYRVIKLFIVCFSSVILVLLMFSLRLSTIEQIDRFRFFIVFLENVKDWHFVNFLFGAERITPLSPDSCNQLSYYNNLFSYRGDGSCYSVVLHSYVLRVIFDHGLAGFFFICYSTYAILVQNEFKKKFSIAFTIMIIINGLSVSSFNNIFFAISMVLLLTTKRRGNLVD